MITLRQVKPQDWQLVRAVRLAALADAPEAFGETVDNGRARSDADWQRRAKEGAEGERSFCCLAFSDKEACGMAVGLPDGDHPHLAYLVAMWVAPYCRGGEAGPKLVERVEMWARGRGARSLVAGVSCGNDRADAFYRKNGFYQYGGEPLTHPAASGCATALVKDLV